MILKAKPITCHHVEFGNALLKKCKHTTPASFKDQWTAALYLKYKQTNVTSA